MMNIDFDALYLNHFTIRPCTLYANFSKESVHVPNHFIKNLLPWDTPVRSRVLRCRQPVSVYWLPAHCGGAVLLLTGSVSHGEPVLPEQGSHAGHTQRS